MADFFISFEKTDRGWAEWIAWQLEAAGYTTTFQHWDFLPGRSFVAEMDKAARESHCTLAVLSPDYLLSAFGAAEWMAAFAEDPTGEKGSLIPIRVRETPLTGLLRQRIYVDLVGVEEAVAKQKILVGVSRKRAKPEKKPDYPGEKPAFPGEPPPVSSPPAPPTQPDRATKVQRRTSGWLLAAGGGALLAAVILRSLSPSLAASFIPAPQEGAPIPALLIPQGMPPRLDPGVPTGTIWRLSTDAAGRTLATAAADGTVRLWKLADGSLLRTLRPPLGDPALVKQDLDPDKVQAVALSPDGHLVAAGGNVGAEDEYRTRFSVYLFDSATGALVRRIGDLPNDIKNLTFSRDGLRLAIVFGDYFSRRGVMVFRVADGRKEGEDLYKDISYGVDFDPTGRLVTTDFGGNIRLYDERLRLLASTKVDGLTFAARFSPDGRQIAVGNTSYSRVKVLAAADLSPVKELRGPDSFGSFAWASVSWSDNGRTLYAGNREQPLVRRWVEGLDEAVDIKVPARVLDLVPLPQGRMAFATAEPGWGILDTQDKVRLYRGPVANRPAAGSLLLSRTGSTLGLEAQGKPVVFSVPRLELSTGRSPVMAGLLRPLTSFPGVEARIEKEDLVLNGSTVGTGPPQFTSPLMEGLFIDRYPAADFALAPDGSAVFLGNCHDLVRYDKNRKKLWAMALPNAAQAVNVSGDGRLVVAALSDGTVQWRRADTGDLLLTLYIHPDLQRWALWTPAGEFEIAPRAPSLLGWPVSLSLDRQALWIPAPARPTFRRPQAIQAALQIPAGRGATGG